MKALPAIGYLFRTPISFKKVYGAEFSTISDSCFQEIPTETMIEPYAAISLTEHSIPDEITNAFSNQQSNDGAFLSDKVEMPV